MPDDWSVGRGKPADDGSEPGGFGHAHGIGEGGHRVDRRTERHSCAVRSEELLGLFDQPERRRFTLVAGRAPADHPVATEHRARRVGMYVTEGSQREPQLEPGTLPLEPSHVVTEALGHESLAVSGRRERNHRVGMQVVDMVEVDERVQRGVDRGHRTTITETARRVRRHDVVLVRSRSMPLLERVDPVEHEEGEPRLGEGSEVSPEPFTASTRVGTPVTGSSDVSLADVLPPAKFVTRLSAPRRWERASSSSRVGSTTSGMFASL